MCRAITVGRVVHPKTVDEWRENTGKFYKTTVRKIFLMQTKLNLFINFYLIEPYKWKVTCVLEISDEVLFNSEFAKNELRL